MNILDLSEVRRLDSESAVGGVYNYHCLGQTDARRAELLWSSTFDLLGVLGRSLWLMK